MLLHSLVSIFAAVFALLACPAKAAAAENLLENFASRVASRQAELPLVLGQLTCQYVNVARSGFGLNELHFSVALTSTAARHAHWMSMHGSLQHQDLQDLTILTSQRHRLPVVAENLATTWMPRSVESLPADVYNQWIQSAPHRANILSPDVTHCGTGFDVDSHGRIWAVQLFAASPFAPADDISRTAHFLRDVLSGPFPPTLPSPRPLLVIDPERHGNGNTDEDGYPEK